MEVLLYHNNSENNTINKNITLIDTIDCIVKSSISITTPNIIATYDGDIFNCDYCYIADFNRYYFIKDVVPLTGNRYNLELVCDVLESYKNEILNLECIIDKQENVFNNFYDDGSYKSLVTENASIYNFSNGFNEDGEFILITCGGS